MSSRQPEIIFQKIIDSSLVNNLAKEIDISQLVIPFSQICRTYKLIDIYSGNETIPFNERDPEYKMILRQEFSKLNDI